MIHAAMQHAMRSPLQSAMDRIGSAVWTPATLFAASEQGVWYDPSDFSTLFQDTAGTTPVTAVGQPVGRILDKSGRGNHATQATAAARPVLSARVNLLTKTEQFADGFWYKANVAAADNAVTAPDGTTTAATITNNATNAVHILQSGSVAAGFNTQSVYAKAGTASFMSICDASAGFWAGFNLTTGAVTASAGCTPTITADLNGYYRCVLGAPTDPSGFMEIAIGETAADVVPGTAYVGTGKTVHIWHPQVEAGSVATTYQRVNTATDYDTVGFPHYLAFDGVDDSMATAAINFTATDKMSFTAGYRREAQTVGVLAELTDNFNGKDAFAILTPENNSRMYFALSSPGLYSVAYIETGVTDPVTEVFSASADRALSINEVYGFRRNGASSVITRPNNDDTPGNFLNAPLYIGMRAGTSIPFNGRIYSLIVRGALSDAAQIAAAEAYVNSKTGAY